MWQSAKLSKTMGVLFPNSALRRLGVDASGREILDSTCECVIRPGRGHKIGELAYMRSELKAESVLSDIRVCFKHWLEQLFESIPRVLFQPWSRGVACGTNTVETRFVSTLVDSFAFGDGGLGARGIGAKDHFGPSINVTIRQETTRANLSVNTEIGNGYNGAGTLSPLRLGLTNLRD